MVKKIKLWSVMLTEKEHRKSLVYREGSKFVYDSGSLPVGLSVTVGCVLSLQRQHGITATQMPGRAEDWIVIGGGSGEGGSFSQVQSDWSVDDSNNVAYILHKPKFKTVNGQNIVGTGNIEISGGSQVPPDSSLSGTSTNAVQNKVIKIALDAKVNAEDGKGLSTNDFTTALKSKLELIPDISINGNTITINGTDYTLTPAGGGSTAFDYYIGWTNGSKSDFAALSASALETLSTGYTKTQNPTYTGTYGTNRIFFLLYKSNDTPMSIVLTSSGQSMTQNIETDNTCPHDPVTINGTTFQVFGIFASSNHDVSDSMTITF